MARTRPQRRLTSPHAYRREGDAGSVHLDYTESRTGRRRGRDIAYAEYRVVANQPDDATQRDVAAWRAWCQARVAAENLPTPAPEE